jgi:hypothetical protein
LLDELISMWKKRSLALTFSSSLPNTTHGGIYFYGRLGYPGKEPIWVHF